MSERGSAIAAVTFDCWGTLIIDSDMEPAVERRTQAVVEVAEGRLDLDAAAALCDRAWQRHHAEWTNGVQFGAAGMASVIAEELGLGEAATAELTAAFEDASLLGKVAPLPGAAETLAAIRRAGLRTALVCDTGFTPGRLVRGFLERFDIAPHLEFLAFSNEVGVPKPDPRIFQTALDAIEARPESAVHVGDLLRTDIAGAKALGMRSVRITAVNDHGLAESLPGFRAHGGAPDEPIGIEADAVVRSHAELLDTLRSFGAAL